MAGTVLQTRLHSASVLTCTPFSVSFLSQDWKVLIDCSEPQVALVLLRSKHWALDPKYFITEDAVGVGFKSFAFLPISNVIQNRVHFLIYCSHSHMNLLEAEHTGDCKKISWKNFWSWHIQKNSRG